MALFRDQKLRNRLVKVAPVVSSFNSFPPLPWPIAQDMAALQFKTNSEKIETNPFILEKEQNKN